MSAIQRDYIERMIEQCAEAIAQIVLLVRSGEFDRGLIVVQKTSDLVLGRDRAVFERLDAASVVELLGKYELDRVRMYAALLGEEGLIREARGQAERAHECLSRALQLYSAISASGARLMSADQERMTAIQASLDTAGAV
jgi:hypothetical protein